MFGNPIMCPTVTLEKDNLKEITVFDKDYVASCDYNAWVSVRDLPGDFVYCPTLLLGHRIHIESESSSRIADNTRSTEDIKILQRLSPGPIARMIHKAYSKGEKSNTLGK